jgi:hypothetical protein
MCTDTQIAVTSAVPLAGVRALYNRVLDALSGDGVAFSHHTDPDQAIFTGNHEFYTIPDQGLPAKMILAYNPAGGLLANPDSAEDAPRPTGTTVLIDLCTSPSGSRADHEDLVRAVGKVLDDAGLSWQWQFHEDPWQTERP